MGGLKINPIPSSAVTSTNALAGASVAGAGDVNNDGFDDIIVGAPNYVSRIHNGFFRDIELQTGGAFVVFGKDNNTAVELSDIKSGTGGFLILGREDGDKAGFSVSGAGDVDGDGKDDLVVGNYAGGYVSENGQFSGDTYLVLGKSDTAQVDLDDIYNGLGGFVVKGESQLDMSGFSVSGNGDINGDGLYDIIIGAERADPNGLSSGSTYVIFGDNISNSVDIGGTMSFEFVTDDILSGTNGDENIFAGSGNDKIIGTKGADNLSGGAGADVFEFTSDDGVSTILDFSQIENDQIDISDFGFPDFISLQSKFSNSGQGNQNTKIELDTDTFVYLEDFKATELLVTDFIF